LRPTLDPRDTQLNRQRKLAAKPFPLRMIVFDGFVKFLLGLGQKLDLHGRYFAKTSLASRAVVSPLP